MKPGFRNFEMILKQKKSISSSSGINVALPVERFETFPNEGTAL